MIRRSILGLMATVAFAPLAWAEEAAVANDAPRPVVSEIVTPVLGVQESWVGTVAARVETDLGFPALGTVADRGVEVGDVVKRGDILAMQDPQDLDTNLRAAQAGVTVVEAQAQSARDAAARASALVERGVSSLSAAQSTTAQLAAAKSLLEQAQATLAQAQDARSKAALFAPQDGVVTQVFAEAGTRLAAGAAVLRLAGTDAREVVIDLSEQDVAGLVIGAGFEIVLESNPALQAKGTLVTIDPVATTQTRTRRLHLELASDAPSGFRLGALVQVMPAAQNELRTALPVVALIAGRDAPTVWRVSPQDRHVEARQVQTGVQIGDNIMVLGGLSDGDEIITRGVNSIKDGQIVGPRVTE